MDKIIFITPFFGNTGSDIALFNLIVRIKGLEIIVISKQRGSLASRLPNHIKFYDYKSFCRKKKWSIRWLELKTKLTRSRLSVFDYFLETILNNNKGTIYVNTLTLPDVVNYLNRKRYPYILHAHELQHMLASIRKQEVLAMVEGAAFIFTSSKVCGRVLHTLGRDQNITHNYPGIEIEKIKVQKSPYDLRESLKIPKNAFVIAMSGTIDSNKNPEAFLEIGRILKEKGHLIHLVWIGANKENGYSYFLRKKSIQYGLEFMCSWVSKLEGEDYYEHLNICDCFALTSRQESFSIVVVEALTLGKPVFSFRSGGPEEIINNESIGVFIDDHSPLRMAEVIEKLIKRELSFDADMAKRRGREFSADNAYESWKKTLHERNLLGV